MADISKITPPGSQTTYNLKDATAREQANWNTNNGVKNLCPTNTVQYTGTGGYTNPISIGLPAGTYVLSFKYTSTGNGAVEYTVDGNAVTKYFNTGTSEYHYYTITATTGFTSIRFYFNAVGSIDELMVCPKSLYDADSTYEPYALPNTKITPELIELVDSGAKNIFNEPVITTGSAGEINITVNGDGTFTLNTSGATTENSGVRIGWFTGKQGVTYAVSNYSPSCQLRVRYGSDIILDTSGGANTFVAPSNAKGELIWYVPSGTTLTNYVLKPMICTKAAWDVSQKFVPYRPTYEETVEQVAENENNISLSDKYIADHFVDVTGKNKLNAVNTTGTRWFNNTINLPAGDYVLSLGSLTTTATTDVCQIGVLKSGDVALIPYTAISVGNNVYVPFSISETAVTLRIYAAESSGAAIDETVTVSNAMICTAEDWHFSQKYIPYST